jgi:murein DD-endopeptidase MepM/ murein hydrolase activator NlpD
MFRRKLKYQFDTEKLSYVYVKQTFWKSIFRGVVIILPGFFISFLFLYLLLNTINSPVEKYLQSKSDSLLLKYDILNKKIFSVNTEIEAIAINDNHVYRPFFEMDSIPGSIRKAGFGGTDRYKYLRISENSDLLVNITKNVDIISKQLYIQSISFDEIIESIDEKEKMLKCIPSIRPVKLEDIDAICSFGMRMHPLLGIYRMHKGVDLCAPENTEIFAAGNGIVEISKFHESLGNYLIINHGFGYKTVYGHLNKALVSVGDTVSGGDLIALMGTTGISTIEHVHYEVHKNGEAVNPMKFYYWDLTDVEYNCLVSNNTEAESFFMN